MHTAMENMPDAFTMSRATFVETIPTDPNAHFQLHAQAAAAQKFVAFPPAEILNFLIREPSSPFTERLVFILNVTDAILTTELRRGFLAAGGAAALISALSAHAGTPKTTHQLSLFAATLARCSDAHDAMHEAGSVPALLALLARYSRTEHYAVSVTMVGALQLLTEGKGRKRDPALASLGTLRLWTRMLLTWRPPAGVDHAEVLVAMVKLLTRGVGSPAEKHMAAEAYVSQLLDTAQVLIGLTFAHCGEAGVEFCQDLMHALMAVTTRCPSNRVAEVLNKGLPQLAVFMLADRCHPVHGFCNTHEVEAEAAAAAAAAAAAGGDAASLPLLEAEMGAPQPLASLKGTLAAAVAEATARLQGASSPASLLAAAERMENEAKEMLLAEAEASTQQLPPSLPALPPATEAAIAAPTLAMTTISLLHRVVVGAASARDASEAVIGAGCVPLLIGALARDSEWQSAIVAAGPASAALAIVIAQLKVLAADTFSYVASHCKPDSRLVMILSGVPAVLGASLSDALIDPESMSPFAATRRCIPLPAAPVPSLVKALAAVIGVPHKTLHALAPMEKFDAAAVLVAARFNAERFDAAAAAAAGREEAAAAAALQLVGGGGAACAADSDGEGEDEVDGGDEDSGSSNSEGDDGADGDCDDDDDGSARSVPYAADAAPPSHAKFAPEKPWAESAIPEDACVPPTSRVTEVFIGAAVPFLLAVLAGRSAHSLSLPAMPEGATGSAAAVPAADNSPVHALSDSSDGSAFTAVIAAASTANAPPPSATDAPLAPGPVPAPVPQAGPWDKVAELAVLSLEALARRHHCHRKAIRRSGGSVLCQAIVDDPCARPQLQAAARRTHALIAACCATGYHTAASGGSGHHHYHSGGGGAGHGPAAATLSGRDHHASKAVPAITAAATVTASTAAAAAVTAVESAPLEDK